MLALCAIIIGLALYFDMLNYTYFSDDPVYLRVARQFNMAQILTTTTAFSYYRPLNFVPLRALIDLTGSAPALTLHIMALSFHILNGWLVGLLAYRLFSKFSLIPLLVAALYLTVPFAYQAVPWMASMGHPMVATGILIGILFAERWLKSGHWLNLLIILLGALLANLAHENGIITGAVIVVWLWGVDYEFDARRLREDWRRVLPAVLVPLAVNIAYMLLWTYKSNNPPTNFLENIVNNTQYFLQGFTYPISQFGYALGQRLQVSDFTAAAIITLIGAIVLGGGLWLNGDRRVIAPLLWMIGGVVLPTLFLDWGYVFSSPRMLVTSAPAMALVWGAAIHGYWKARFPIVRVAAPILAALALIGGAWFVRSRLEMQTRFDRMYHDIYAQIKANGDGALFFNIPGWISPKQRIYALGVEGVVYKPSFLQFHDLVMGNTGISYKTNPVLWHDNIPLHDAYWMEYVDQFQPGLDERLAAVRGAKRVFRVKALPSSFVLEEADRADPNSWEGALEFSNHVRVLVNPTLDKSRGMVNVDLTLQTLDGHVQEKLFIHLLCGDQILSQADGALLGEIYPYDYWEPGETWHEIRVMEVPAGTPRDCLALRIGMFHPATGIRPTLPDGSEWAILPIK